MFFETIHPSLMKFRRNDAAMVFIRICWKNLIPAKETCIDSGVWNFYALYDCPFLCRNLSSAIQFVPDRRVKGERFPLTLTTRSRQ